MATSQITQAIIDIKTQCLAIPGIVYCAVDNHQVVNASAGTTFAFPMPAILVSMSNPDWGQQLLGLGVTVTELWWKINIVYQELSAPSDGTPGSGMDENLSVFAMRDLVKTALTGFQPTNCSQLQYLGECQDYNHNSIYVYEITFKCSFVDTKGSPLDADSTLWVTGTITDYNLNTFEPWVSGKTYDANSNAVLENTKIYLCTTTNEDTTFNTANWMQINAWIPSATYTAATSYVAYQNHIYQCVNSNTDASFNGANWSEVVS